MSSLLLICNLLNAQAPIEITIVDSVTNEVLPFASILNLSQKRLYYSDNDGKAFIDNSNNSDSYEVCFLSYHCKRFRLGNNNLNERVIRLVPKPIELEAVVVKPKKNNKLVVGYHKSKTDFKWGSGSGLIFANFFKNNYPETPYISKIFVDLNASVKEKRNTLIRVRMYHPNADGSPGDNFLDKNLYYQVKRIQGHFEISTDTLNIKIPNEGIVVGIEIIGYYVGKKLETSQKGTYTIGICSTKDPKRQDIGSAWRYSTFEKKWFSANYGKGEETMFKIGMELSD